MAGELPDYFFRVRENGAVVFRVDTENRQRRIDMEEIATVNVNNGKIKPHGDRLLTKAETALMAVEQGVRAVVILDGRLPNASLLELFTEHGAGSIIREPR